MVFKHIYCITTYRLESSHDEKLEFKAKALLVCLKKIDKHFIQSKTRNKMVEQP